MHHCFLKNIKQHNFIQHLLYKELFTEPQISILELFLKNHVTPKTKVIAAENSALPSLE